MLYSSLHAVGRGRVGIVAEAFFRGGGGGGVFYYAG